MAVWKDQCGTCIGKNRCMERSRLQACRGYIKKDPGSCNCGRSKRKIIAHPHYTEGEGELQDGKDNKDHQQQ